MAFSGYTVCVGSSPIVCITSVHDAQCHHELADGRSLLRTILAEAPGGSKRGYAAPQEGVPSGGEARGGGCGASHSFSPHQLDSWASPGL
jgi:hypothetical protein